MSRHSLETLRMSSLPLQKETKNIYWGSTYKMRAYAMRFPTSTIHPSDMNEKLNIVRLVKQNLTIKSNPQ